jgi:molybdate transport system substrate-binding protein
MRALRIPCLALVSVLRLAAAAPADELKVITSGAFTAAYLELVPEFERATKHTIATAFGASMGNAPDSIPSRLQRGEPVDVVIMADTALDDLITQGKVVAGSRVDLVRSSIGVAVRAGAPKPDISSVDALRRTLLNAKSIAYSASASGVYVSTELFQRLGIADQVKGKSQRIDSARVGAVVARGDAEIGFQQISELLPVQGIDYLGPLPAEVQKVTVFSAGITTSSAHPDAARALIRFLASPAVVPVIRKSGLEPITPEQQNDRHAVQEPGAAAEVRRAARARKDFERDLRGVESRDRRQEAAGARQAEVDIEAEILVEADIHRRAEADLEVGRRYRAVPSANANSASPATMAMY